MSPIPIPIGEAASATNALQKAETKNAPPTNKPAKKINPVTPSGFRQKDFGFEFIYEYYFNTNFINLNINRK